MAEGSSSKDRAKQSDVRSREDSEWNDNPDCKIYLIAVDDTDVAELAFQRYCKERHRPDRTLILVHVNQEVELANMMGNIHMTPETNYAPQASSSTSAPAASTSAPSPASTSAPLLSPAPSLSPVLSASTSAPAPASSAPPAPSPASTSAPLLSPTSAPAPSPASALSPSASTPRSKRIESKYNLLMYEKQVNGRFITTEGECGNAIIEEADKVNADVIVLGYSRRSSSRRKSSSLGAFVQDNTRRRVARIGARRSPRLLRSRKRTRGNVVMETIDEDGSTPTPTRKIVKVLIESDIDDSDE